MIKSETIERLAKNRLILELSWEPLTDMLKIRVSSKTKANFKRVDWERLIRIDPPNLDGLDGLVDYCITTVLKELNK